MGNAFIVLEMGLTIATTNAYASTPGNHPSVIKNWAQISSPAAKNKTTWWIKTAKIRCPAQIKKLNSLTFDLKKEWDSLSRYL